MEHDIFISYSRKDTEIVNQFVKRLTDAGYRVWIDREGIYSGDQFKAKIVRAIKGSAIVLYFSSVNSNASDWTVKEISYSLKKGKTIIPIKLDDTEYEDSIDFDLVNIDFIKYDPNQPSACINRLIASIAAHGCNRSGSHSTTSATPSQPGMSPEELFSLGEEHYNNKKYWQAVKHLRKAAEQGHAEAQSLLGVCYLEGKGILQDDKQAVYWFRKAAEQGDTDSQRHLGYCYYNGHGVYQDLQQAFYWYKKAAEQGHDYSQYFLGFCYEYGKGVKQDNKQASYWYNKAAKQGNEYAIRNLERLKKLKKI